MSATREPRAPAPVLRNETRVRVSGVLMRRGMARAALSGSRVLPWGAACGLHGRNNPVVSARGSY